jgi:catalase
MATLRARMRDENLYEQVIDTLNEIFGSHPGFRPVHAKGMVCEGTFQATADARTLTRAPHMQGNRVPVNVRFSDFSGVPVVSDGDPTASPRGMAVRFQLPDGPATDIVAHSYNGFPARDAAEFLEFLRALASSGPNSSKPTPLETFIWNHPAAKQFIEAPKPAPESFATESYYGVDAFRFVNREEQSRYGRYRIAPAAGERHVQAGEAARRAANFLFDEVMERLHRGPIEFRLLIQLSADNDPIDDPTRPWPESRQQVNAGTLTITQPLVESDTIQRKIAFDPARLPDGIEPGDPLINVRSAVYAIAMRRRGA